MLLFLLPSVADPRHFGVDSDPDPRIHASDPCLWLMDPDPFFLVIDLQDANKKLIFFFCLLLFESTFTSFLKIKSQKESKIVGIKVFYYFFAFLPNPDPDPYLWLMNPDSGGPKTWVSGSGSATLLLPLLFRVQVLICSSTGFPFFISEPSARIYRPSFRENKPKTLVFSHRKRAFWACFRENWVYKFGHRL